MSESYTVAELESMLAEARRVEQAAAKARREAVVPEYRFTVEPASDNWDRLHDNTCRFYRLIGEITNEEALREVGAMVPQGGAMKYVYNSGTGKIVCAVGGGTSWPLTDEGWGLIGDLIAVNPNGGDVTWIVNQFRDRRPY